LLRWLEPEEGENNILVEENLKLVVNNARFLILPWIRSENLASRMLGGVCRQLPMDWQARYGYHPALLETIETR
jgi:hypothetical protein